MISVPRNSSFVFRVSCWLLILIIFFGLSYSLMDSIFNNDKRRIKELCEAATKDSSFILFWTEENDYETTQLYNFTLDKNNLNNNAFFGSAFNYVDYFDLTDHISKYGLYDEDNAIDTPMETCILMIEEAFNVYKNKK